MRAFVTGGTGFVGSHLVEDLLASGKYTEIRCLVRSSEKWLKGMDVTLVKGDLDNYHAIADALTDVDVIFHIAGLTKAPRNKDFTAANVDATENLMRIAQKKGISNFVITSSLAAVGPSHGTPLTEKEPLRPVSMYGNSKKRMEVMIGKTALQTDSIKIIRPPAVYGPREADIYTFFKTYKMGLCPMVGDGNHPRLSLVYVKDLSNGIMKAADKTETGVHSYFMGGEQDSYSWNQISAVTGHILGVKPLTLKLKPGIVRKVASFIETGASLFGKYPVVNNEKAAEMVEEWVCSSRKAIKELGYFPKTTLEEGLSRTLHWYKNNNWL